MSYISKSGRLAQARSFVDRIKHFSGQYPNPEGWTQASGAERSPLWINSDSQTYVRSGEMMYKHTSGNLYWLVGYDPRIAISADTSQITLPDNIHDKCRLFYYKIDTQREAQGNDTTISRVNYCLPSDLVKSEGQSLVEGVFSYGSTEWSIIGESHIFLNNPLLYTGLTDLPHWVSIETNLSMHLLSDTSFGESLVAQGRLSANQMFNTFALVERMLPANGKEDSRVIPCVAASGANGGASWGEVFGETDPARKEALDKIGSKGNIMETDANVYDTTEDTVVDNSYTVVRKSFNIGYSFVVVQREPVSISGAGGGDSLAFNTVLQF